MIWVFRDGNVVGHLIRAINYTPSVARNLHSAKCCVNNYVSSLQLLIALKCYKRATEALPESLTELVPEYIDAVPIDDYDGKPMTYSKEKRIIYTVGPWLEETGDEETRKPPWTFRIES
jgi:hypothetical protein